MAKRFRMKSKMLQDADVQWVSLVSRPANRIPFRVTKMDEDGNPVSDPEDRMFDLAKVFTRKQHTPDVLAVAIKKEMVDQLQPALADSGVCIDHVTVEGDLSVYKQVEFSEEDVTVVEIDENVSVAIPFSEKIETIAKGFMPYAESEKYTDNLKAGSYVPGIAMATDVLLQTFSSILRDGEGVDEVRSKMQRAIREYAKYVLALTDELPSMVFKIEGRSASVTGLEEDMTDTVEKADGEIEQTEESVQIVEEEAVEKAETNEVQPETEEATVAETVEKDDDAVEDKSTEVEQVEVEKSEPSIAELLAEALTPLKDGFAAIKESLDEVRKGQEEIEERLDSVEEVARKADEAVSGKVISSVDSQDDSFGTLSRHARKARKSDDDLWAGTSLDKISG